MYDRCRLCFGGAKWCGKACPRCKGSGRDPHPESLPENAEPPEADMDPPEADGDRYWPSSLGYRAGRK